MTQVSRTTYKSITSTDFPNNTTGQISPSDLRGQLDNIADSSPFMTTGKISAPTLNDDSAGTGGNGTFNEGDIWVDELNNNAYICIDDTPTLAAWYLIGGNTTVSAVGTTNANEIPYFVANGLVDGSSDFTWNGTTFAVTGNITVTGTVDGRDVAADGTKLDTIEPGATADQTGAEIKALYEAELDTNAFTDAEKTKLAGIGSGANVSKIGTPVDNQIAVWTGDGTIEGNSALTFDVSTLTVNAETPTVRLQDTSSLNFSEISNSDTVLRFAVDTANTETGSAIVLDIDGGERIRFDENGMLMIGDYVDKNDIRLRHLTSAYSVSPSISVENPAGIELSRISGYVNTTDIPINHINYLGFDVYDTTGSIYTGMALYGEDPSQDRTFQIFNDASGVIFTVNTTGNSVLKGYLTATQQVNAQIGTSYILALTDTNGIVTMSNAGANTVVINPVATTAYPIGYVVEVVQLGAGATSIEAATGVTLNGVPDGIGTLTAQYDVVRLRHVASNVWIVSGDIGAIS